MTNLLWAITPRQHFGIAFLVAILVFFVGWRRFRLMHDPTAAYEMEPKGRTFEPMLTRYVDIAKLIISLAVGSIALLTGYLGFVMQKGHLERVQLLYALQVAVTWPLTLLAFSVVYLVFLCVSLTGSYERYWHLPNSYTGAGYAGNLTLGYSGLTCFALGYLLLVFFAISIGSP